MKISIEITGRQTVVVDAPDADIERHGLKAVAEEYGYLFDPDTADWDYDAEIVTSEENQ